MRPERAGVPAFMAVAQAGVPATAPTTNPPAPGWHRVPTGRPPGSPQSPTTHDKPCRPPTAAGPSGYEPARRRGSRAHPGTEEPQRDIALADPDRRRISRPWRAART